MITEALKIEPSAGGSLEELPFDVAWLIEAFVEAGRRDQATAAAPRAVGPRLVRLDGPSGNRGPARPRLGVR